MHVKDITKEKVTLCNWDSLAVRSPRVLRRPDVYKKYWLSLTRLQSLQLTRFWVNCDPQSIGKNDNADSWKLLKRPTPEVRKRVYVCPDTTCLHNDPCHALGDLVGIKKHFRRKHSIEKQWKCEKCSKGYAVQSDYKAHLKTCGTRGHSCDCGRVFSRVESFIEHQDTCITAKERAAFGYCIDPPSLPSLTAGTRSSNDTLSATRSGHSSVGIQFDSGKLHEQAANWLNKELRELQFLPAKHQSDTFETAIRQSNNAVGTVTRDHIRSLAYDPRSNLSTSPPKEHRFLDDTSESPLRLQLSIGLCTDPSANREKKPYVKPDQFSAVNQRQRSNRTGIQIALGLTLSSNDSFPGNNNVEANYEWCFE